jgi:hypothetical protein
VIALSLDAKSSTTSTYFFYARSAADLRIAAKMLAHSKPKRTSSQLESPFHSSFPLVLDWTPENEATGVNPGRFSVDTGVGPKKLAEQIHRAARSGEIREVPKCFPMSPLIAAVADHV